jgi:hypothetical protein
MKLGVCYNLFDGEELLESSILSIRNVVDHICVVYQTTSNYDQPCNPHLKSFLEYLKEERLVDSVIYYETKFHFPLSERENIVSKKARADELGGPIEMVGDQFFNETSKREIGRKDCLKNGCTHFLSMDTDEYYFEDEVRASKKLILQNKWEFTACRMRVYGKYPTIEYVQDDINAVPYICVCTKDKELRLATPYPLNGIDGIKFTCALDPTRRIDGVDYSQNKFYLFDRDQVEMHHMTFLRKDISKKLTNVSNKANYGDISNFLKEWDSWTPEEGIIHPHPYIKKMFQNIKIVPNFFDIDIDLQCNLCCKTFQIMRCGDCKTVRYCSEKCQAEDWSKHKLICKKILTI